MSTEHKAVLLSIQPEWFKKILSGEKTVADILISTGAILACGFLVGIFCFLMITALHDHPIVMVAITFLASWVSMLVAFYVDSSMKGLLK